MKISFIGLTCLIGGVVAETPWERANKLVHHLTLEEKVALTHGNKSACSQAGNVGYVGCVPAIPRLGIPAILLQDGPQGFRCPDCDGTSTQWPSGMTMGMSWDSELMLEWGKAMGKEFYQKGANVMFGPAVNLHRVPTNGRNFEYISGEDPYLGHMLVKPIIEGVQEQGVIANVKHYINNNQEGINIEGEDGPGDRHSTSSNVDERTQVELYFQPFLGAIDAGVLSAMCGNNLVNGVHSCENNFTQNTLFREWFGFAGFICSDYRGSQTLLGSAMGGLDMQLPGCDFASASDPSGLTCQGQQERPNVFGKPLADAVRSGLIAEEVLDAKVQRILYALATVGALDRNTTGDIKANVTGLRHIHLAQKFAAQSAVLLKNEGLLPLRKQSIVAKGIAVIGTAAHDAPITGGGGSGSVVPAHTVTIFEGLRDVYGSSVSYLAAKGQPQKAADFAAKAGFAVVVLAESSSEGHDRLNLTLPDAELVKAVAKKQKNTIVIVAAPGAFLAPWADHVPSILATFFSGQAQGAAVAALLSGAVSPSGKLSLSIPNTENEMAMTKEQYPGIPYKGNCTLGFTTCYTAEYAEQLAVGYRWYHSHGIRPKFPFGHGLTYSPFAMSATRFLYAKGKAINASVIITNVGSVIAAEVVQLYITYPPSAREPPRQLRGFKKTWLAPGTSAKVNFALSSRDLSIWDEVTHMWRLVEGSFTFECGFSSENLPIRASVRMPSLEELYV